MIVKILISVAFAFGLILFIFSLVPLPSVREGRQIRKLGRKKKHIDAEKIFIAPIAKRISKWVRLSSYNKKNLDRKLVQAGLQMTAEYYIARAISLSLAVFVIAVILILTKIYILVFLGVIFIIASIIFYLKAKDEVNERLKKKKEEIKKELPQFMRTITQTLLFSRDILAMVDKYRLVAGPELRSELNVLVLDMKTGNPEAALTAFAERLDIDYLTAFVKGLVSQSKGIEQSKYLKSVEEELKTKTVEALRTEANKVPSKLHIAQFSLVASIALIWLAAIGLAAFMGYQTMSNF